MELRMCRTVMLNSDFYEGVRALLVDKDNQPAWKPNKIEDVTNEMVQSYFEPMPDGAELEIWLQFLLLPVMKFCWLANFLNILPKQFYFHNVV